MRRNGRVRSGDEEATSHAEMDEELGGLFCVIFGSGQVSDDGLTDAMNAVDTAAREHFDDLVGRRLEGLGLVAGLYADNCLAVNAGVDAVGYGFDFGEFGHAFCSIWGEA